MKLITITILLTIASVSTFASTLKCSNADGSVKITASQYDGEARPRPGMETGRETWLYLGKEVGTKIQMANLGAPRSTGRLGEFAQEQIIVDDSMLDTKPTGKTVYAVKVKAPKSSTGTDTVVVSVICESTFATVPRP